MPIATSVAVPTGSSSSDPLLTKLAEANTFDDEWPTVRDRLRQRLLSIPSVFLARGPPPEPSYPTSPPAALIPPSSPIQPDDDTLPPAESLLLSPSTPTAALSPLTTTPNARSGATPPNSTTVEASSSPSSSSSNLDDLRPSTQGGLVLPPFPPLDPNRRRGGSPAIRANGVGGIINGRLGPTYISGGMEEEWDEEVLIGGKKLAGWMEEEEGKGAVDRLVRLLDNFEQPPFTVQRLAELLLSPTRHHTTLGKFLRAVEKTLLVTTYWQPPSYTPLPIPAMSGAGRNTYFSSSSASSASSSSSDDEDDGEAAMMPPGSSTPMFSPIMFARSDTDTDSEEVEGLRGGLAGLQNGGDGAGHSRREEGLMSPLMLEGGDRGATPGDGGGEGSGAGSSSSSFQFAQNPTVRSPTPEPEEEGGDVDMSATATDPAHQSYLGRVDELDTGPVHVADGLANGSSDTEGQGEGGNMAPHGMSERPVPISSTTSAASEGGGPEARRIAALPSRGLGDRFVSAGKEGEEAGEEEGSAPKEEEERNGDGDAGGA